MKKILLLNLFVGSFAFAQTPITTSQLNVDDGSFTSTLTGNNLLFSRTNGPAYIWSQNVGGYMSFGTNGRTVGNSNANLVLNTDLSSYFNDNLGIGTNNPTTGLHLWESAANTTVGGDDKSIIRLTNSYSAAFHSGGEIQFGLNNIPGSEVLSTIKGTYSAWNNGNLGGSLEFYTRHSDGLGLKSRMYINSLGNVGVGTSSPSAKLHINSTSVNSELLRLDNNNLRRTSISNYSDGIYDNVGLQFKKESSAGQFKFSNLNGDLFTILSDGDVGIGTIDTKGFKLGVDGKIAATEVKIATYSNWPDFVFENNYNLPTLKEVEQHIKEKGHLKDIPSAEEVKENGIFLGEMDSKLLQKIEELMLY